MPAPTSSPRPTRRASPLAVHPHLTPRDRDLLTLVEDHRVLTSDQLSRVFFTGLRTCQLRLGVLRGLDLLDRFRFARPHGGTEAWKWVLGLAGARFQAATAGRPAPTDRAHNERIGRLAASPTLAHLLATNEFFVRLHHTARTLPAARLDRWWPEQAATARFSGIQPDGHGLWTTSRDPHRQHTVGFFLECDLGTENLSRLCGKLSGYSRLADTGGPCYPVLFWLPSPDREANLQRLLRRDPPDVPVATATHDSDPAGPVCGCP
jgi:Replication-relaxation